MKRSVLLALVASLAFCGTAQAQPWLTMHRARLTALEDARTNGRLDGGVGYVTACHRKHPTVVECQGHEDGITTVFGIGDLSYGVGIHLVRHRIVLRTPFA